MSTTVRWPVSRRVRKLLLVTHVVAAVSLMGHLLVATILRLAASGDAELAASRMTAWYQDALTPMIGGSLSILTLVSGLLLGLATRWGVLRHGWVVAKLVLLVATVAAGILVPAVWLTSTAQWAALLAATVLSVFKPRLAHSDKTAGGAVRRPPSPEIVPASAHVRGRA